MVDVNFIPVNLCFTFGQPTCNWPLMEAFVFLHPIYCTKFNDFSSHSKTMLFCLEWAGSVKITLLPLSKAVIGASASAVTLTFIFISQHSVAASLHDN